MVNKEPHQSPHKTYSRIPISFIRKRPKLSFKKYESTIQCSSKSDENIKQVLNQHVYRKDILSLNSKLHFKIIINLFIFFIYITLD